jgi:hypothetical protein
MGKGPSPEGAQQGWDALWFLRRSLCDRLEGPSRPCFMSGYARAAPSASSSWAAV